MIGINSVVIVGRLTRDIEINAVGHGGSEFSSGRFGIATNRRTRNSNGEYVDQAQFFEVRFSGKTMEAVSPYLKKGTQVGIQGELRQDTWEKDGQRRSLVYIHVSSLMLLGSKQDNNSGDSNSYQNNRFQNKQTSTKPQYEDYNNNNSFKGDIPDEEDDIPF